MPTEQEDAKRIDTEESLMRMQSFDLASLPREKELGTVLNFRHAVEPAKALVELYKRIPATVLGDFPVAQLLQILNQANNDYNRLKEILDFKAGQPVDARDSLIKQLGNSYQASFSALHPLISYAASKAADFQRLETEARAMIQSVQDQGEKIAEKLQEKQEEAEKILTDIRKAAAEQGVSQQAVYFQQAEKEHEKQAKTWLIATIWLAAAMTLYAVASLFIHKIPLLRSDTVYGSIQLGVSKTLVFAVISYMLYLCARNFLANKHNSIVNKHRQNALMTYKAILNAAKDIEQKEIILTHAASCIFGPQNTGYSRSDGDRSPSAKSVVGLLTKPFTPDE